MTTQLQLWESQAPSVAAPTVRPIHYLGGKSRILDDIRAAVDAADPTAGPACDLFSGSGVVAAALASCRDVVTVDIQEYARVLAAALLSPNRLPTEIVEGLAATAREIEDAQMGAPLSGLVAFETEAILRCKNGDPAPLAEILERGSLLAFERGESLATGPLRAALRVGGKRTGRRARDLPGPPLVRYFGGLYFSYRQALGLQAALQAAETLPRRWRDTGTAAVLSAASELVSTVGSHFAQPLRPRDSQGRIKGAIVTRAALKRSVDAIETFTQWLQRYCDLPQARPGHQAVRSDYREFLRDWDEPLAVVYADPPYTRDHYSRFYHVLETIALGDDPGVTASNLGGGGRLSRGLYRHNRHQSPFCIKSEAPGAFEALFRGVRHHDAPLILSYSPYDATGRQRPRLMTIEQVVESAQRVFTDVTVIPTRPVKHSKLNAQRLNVQASTNAERLVVCRP